MSSSVYEASDYLEIIEYYFQQGLTDGLPIVPPTPNRVNQFLDCSKLQQNDIIGITPVGSIPITAEKVAINSLMAGCLPEYMPVVVAGIKAMLEDKFSLNATASSTSGASHLIIIGGPIVLDLDVNFGANLFGPTKRANATIGRAIRLILINVCGAAPGLLDRSTLGNPGKYTSCIAEDETLSPWSPIRCEFGIPKERNAVTAFACYAPVQVSDHRSNNPEQLLQKIADSIVTYPYYARGCQILVIIVPEHLAILMKAGWTKNQVQQFLFQATQRPMGYWESRPDSGKNDFREGIGLTGVVKIPEDFLVMVAGGQAGGFSSFLVSWGSEVDYSRIVTTSF